MMYVSIWHYRTFIKPQAFGVLHIASGRKQRLWSCGRRVYSDNRLPITLSLESQWHPYLENDQGRLAFSFNQAQGFPEPLKAALKQQKAALLEILSCNRVHSEEKFRALAFYKLPAPYRDTA